MTDIDKTKFNVSRNDLETGIFISVGWGAGLAFILFFCWWYSNGFSWSIVFWSILIGFGYSLIHVFIGRLVTLAVQGLAHVDRSIWSNTPFFEEITSAYDGHYYVTFWGWSMSTMDEAIFWVSIWYPIVMFLVIPFLILRIIFGVVFRLFKSTI